MYFRHSGGEFVDAGFDLLFFIIIAIFPAVVDFVQILRLPFCEAEPD